MGLEWKAQPVCGSEQLLRKAREQALRKIYSILNLGLLDLETDTEIKSWVYLTPDVIAAMETVYCYFFTFLICFSHTQKHGDTQIE